jgi:hypothetical protein
VGTRYAKHKGERRLGESRTLNGGAGVVGIEVESLRVRFDRRRG